METTTKYRPINSQGSDVGKKRHALYKSAIEWIHCSIAGSNYLEAISLAGSLISDRLESRMYHLTGKNEGFRPLEEILVHFPNLEPDAELRKIVSFEVYEWMKKRDSALHDMVKFEDKQFLSWTTRIEANKQVARRGLHLFRKLDKKIKFLNKNK